MPPVPLYFNPRSPCGERPSIATLTGILRLFQPTLPLRGATLASGGADLA